MVLKDHYFLINPFLASPNAGLRLQQRLQVQRRQIFCPHPWRTVDSLQALPRPYANCAIRSSCWLHSPGDKHKFCSCCCPSSHPQHHAWLDGKHPCDLSAALAGNCERDFVLGMQLGQQQGSLSRKMCRKMCLGSPTANWHCPQVAVPGCSTLRFGPCLLSSHLDFILLSPTSVCYLCAFCSWQDVL